MALKGGEGNMMEWDLGDRIGYAIPGTGYWEERKQKSETKKQPKPKEKGSRVRAGSKAPQEGGKK